MSETPSRWITTTALAVAEPVRGVTYKKEQARSTSAPGLTAILRANNIQRDKLDLSDLVFVPDENVSENQMLRKHDIVIAMSSGSISVVGKSAQLREGLAASFGAFCGALRPNKEIEPRYLGCFLKSDAYRSAISELAHGVNINNLKWSHFEEIPLPLAPLPEQKRIADKLDTVLARVDACRDRLDRLPALLKRFRQSILAAATSGRLTEDWRATFASTPIAERAATLVSVRTEMWKGRGKYKPAILASEADSREFLDLPESWIRGTLDQVTWSVKDGPHFSPKYQETGIPFISGGSIKPGKIDLSIAKFISQELHSELSQRCKPDHLDILYTKGGTTGIAAVNTLTDDFNVWVHVAVLKLLPKKCINPFFLQNTLNSPKCYEQSQRYTHGVGNQDLGLTRMVKIVLPIPPIEEQHEIVRRVEILFAFADRLEARLATARKQVGQLTPALLAKAFRGELVPQDPNDEPAAELLKRLAAQRETAPKATRGRKTKVA